MQWFRFYNASINNYKVQSLSGDLFKIWVNILCATSQCDVTPNVTALSFMLRIPENDCQNAINELIKVGLLHFDNGVLIPHQWDEMQYKSDTSAERTRKWRDRNKSITSDVTVTSPDQTRPDTDQIQTRPEKNGHGSFHASMNGVVGGFMPSIEAADKLLSIAPGWDQHSLISKYNTWHNGQERPRNPDAAFLGWAKNFTKGRMPS